MAEFLSDAWFDEMAAAAAGAAAPPEVSLVLQQVVTDGVDEVERAYALAVRGGRVELVRGRVPEPDVTFTQDRATAAAIARGELSAQAAFLAGRLRIGGQPQRFAEAASALAELDDVFAAVRAATRW